MIKDLNKNFLYFLMLCFVFIASFSFIGTNNDNKVETPFFSKSDEKVFADLPEIKENSPFPIVSAQAVLIVDLNSGITLYEKDADKKLLPASTTKIVTALVAMEYYPLDKILTVGRVNVEGQKMNLVYGEKISVNDLLYGLLVYSANDAAEVLAQNYLGGRDGFVFAMNSKAKELYLTNSYFSNPAGLDGNGHYSTARDLVRISWVAMKNSLFSKIVATKEKTVRSEDGKIVHKLTNINKLLNEEEGILGVKTGWTEEARENLVTYIDKDQKKILIAVMGSQDRFGETEELIDWIFENYEWKKVSYPF
ncbi:MAG: D-alanyl-D-alanine carboxypeptidase family protein [Patescibacteria group bacterium]